MIYLKESASPGAVQSVSREASAAVAIPEQGAAVPVEQFLASDAPGSSGPEAQAGRAGELPAAAGGVGLPRLVDLGSRGCIPCKTMAPILEDLTKEYQGRMVVEFIDVQLRREEALGYGIRMIPTQIFIDAAGRELARHEGFMSKEAILNKWKELGVDLDAARPKG
ncbi:MAG: thioredoxin family protein [Candidatus Eisenbacteria bacterium]|uniref:Thioredoxin family protein n=1 Tax=Eiseniibacteriota bacterium TaxID=2212470 RepID=A0A937X6S7_UNCEI|nr:thioredoxin family protein [Candidatus Eisenbacteria bacterium]